MGCAWFWFLENFWDTANWIVDSMSRFILSPERGNKKSRNVAHNCRVYNHCASFIYTLIMSGECHNTTNFIRTSHKRTMTKNKNINSMSWRSITGSYCKRHSSGFDSLWGEWIFHFIRGMPVENSAAALVLIIGILLIQEHCELTFYSETKKNTASLDEKCAKQPRGKIQNGQKNYK